MRKARTISAVLLLTAIAALALVRAPGKTPAGRYVRQLQFPGGPVAVLAEGDLEPRSIGSYSLRIYSARMPKFPTDDFVCGLIRRRNGTIEKAVFKDLDRNGNAELIVIIRSAGSGSYLSADAFHYEKRKLSLVGSVAGLPPDADPTSALAKQLAQQQAPARKTPTKLP